jgi:nucleolar protein TMA23
MDTARYLKSQGWLGAGHALSAGKGLSKPLLVSQKLDVLGLGKKKHNHADQWWTRAFDSSLEGLEVQQGDIGADGAREVTVTQTEVGGLLESLVAGKGALYSMFVKGEGLIGTIGREAVEGKIEEEQEGEQVDSREGSEERRKRKKSSQAVGDKAESELRKERRRRGREIKGLSLSKREDLSAISTPPRANHQADEEGTKPQVTTVGGELKQKRKRRKRAERGLDASESKPPSKRTTATGEEGEATGLGKERTKNRRPIL